MHKQKFYFIILFKNVCRGNFRFFTGGGNILRNCVPPLAKYSFIICVRGGVKIVFMNYLRINFLVSFSRGGGGHQSQEASTKCLPKTVIRLQIHYYDSFETYQTIFGAYLIRKSASSIFKILIDCSFLRKDFENQ